MLEARIIPILTQSAKRDWFGRLHRHGGIETVGILDLLAAWYDCPLPCTIGSANAPDTCPADFNRDCVVDVNDLITMLAQWEWCVPPDSDEN